MGTHTQKKKQMKFRSSATIAIYFLFTILWVILITHASDTKQDRINQLSDMTDIKRQIKSLQQSISPALEQALIPKIVEQNFINRLLFLNEIKKQAYTLQQKL